MTAATDDRLWAAYKRGWDSLDGKPGANDDTRHLAGLYEVAAEAVHGIADKLARVPSPDRSPATYWVKWMHYVAHTMTGPQPIHYAKGTDHE